MAAQSRILSLNLGMQTITLAEFRASSRGSLTLSALKREELIADPAADATRPAQIEAAVDSLRRALNISGQERANVCLPSQSVFTRFVKLPGTTPSEVDSIIGFEAQQNVPFPIDDVIWDYQIMGEAKENIWDVALVAIKSDQLDEINASFRRGGIKSSVIDVAPMALSNAFRYNYSNLSGCSLLIDIGARTTNLVFIEDKRVFSRSIPVGGSTISAAIAKELKQEITVGEKLKIEKGLVGLGGNYAEPENPLEARISKIIRGSMTRLHAEVARSISFYRQNQSGGAPVRAFLCGGTVSLPYMVEFFSEKLQMPIEHFNSLRNVTVANAEVAAQLGGKAHSLGEAIGCALRSLGNSPVEINLRPHGTVREQNLAKRKPFLVLAASCLVLAPAIAWLYFSRGTSVTQSMLDDVSSQVRKLETVAQQFDALEAETKKLQQTAGPLLLAIAERSAWAEILEELGARLPRRFIWVTEIKALSGGKPYSQGIGASFATPSQQQEPAKQPSPGQRAVQPPADEQTKIDSLEVSGLYLGNPPNEKEARIIDEFVDHLQESEVFKIEEKDKAKVVIQRTTPDGQSWAYGYTIVLPLRNPISLP
jgi:type IV pilus assembly protein PilM